MKIIKQVGIIFSICALSVLIEHFLPFAFPASVIGMILLFLFLLSGLLKIDPYPGEIGLSAGQHGFLLYPGRRECHQLSGYSEGQLAAPAAVCVLTTIITFAATACSVRFTMYLLPAGKEAVMSELWASPYFGIALSILAFWAGEKLQKKLKSAFLQPAADCNPHNRDYSAGVRHSL